MPLLRFRNFYFFMALGKGLQSLIPQQKSTTQQEEKSSSPSPILKNVPKGDQIEHIPLAYITPNTHQPRTHFKEAELQDLVQSIKEHGILQPVTVTKKSDGRYELIAGERRYRSAKILGLPTIPAIVRTATVQQKLELALIENIQREDLNPLEEAKGFERLIEEFGLTQEEVAQKVGKSRPAVANTIRLLDLPEEIQHALSTGQLSAGKARALLGLKDDTERLQMFRSMLGREMNVRDVEAAVKEKTDNSSRKGSTRRDPNIMAQEELLRERFGTKVHIAQKGEKGTLSFDYYSLDELKRLLTLLLGE